MVIEFIEAVQRHTADIYRTPCRECRIAMLAQHIALHIGRVHMIMTTDDALEAHGFQRGACTKQAAQRITEFRSGHISRDIQGIGNHNENSFTGILGDIFHHLTNDRNIFLGQSESVHLLSRQNAGAGVTDNHISVTAFLKAPRVNMNARHIAAGQRMYGIQRLAMGHFRLDVNAGNICRQLAGNGSCQNRRTYMT